MKIVEGGGEYHLWLVKDYGSALMMAALLFMGSTVIMESCSGPERPTTIDPAVEQQFERDAYLEVTGIEVPNPETPREVYRQAAIETFVADASQAAGQGRENLCAHYTDAIHILAPSMRIDIACYTK